MAGIWEPGADPSSGKESKDATLTTDSLCIREGAVGREILRKGRCVGLEWGTGRTGPSEEDGKETPELVSSAIYLVL